MRPEPPPEPRSDALADSRSDFGSDFGSDSLVRVDLEAVGRAAREVSLAVQALLVTRGGLHTVRDALPGWLDDADAAPAVRRLVEDLDAAAVAGLTDATELLDDLRRAAAEYALVERAATVSTVAAGPD